VTVERQVLAEPSPRLTGRTWARLADGTPLVTQAARGAGAHRAVPRHRQCRLVEPAALGLFVDMLRRLVALSAGVQGAEGEAPLAPLETLDGFGRLGPAPPAAQPIAANRIEETAAEPAPPARLVRHAGQAARPPQRRALNLGGASARAARRRAAPAGARASIGGVPAERDLGPWLLAVALLLLAADLVISLVLRGLAGRGRAAGGLAALALAPRWRARRRRRKAPGAAALATRLAYVVTGDSEVDEISAWASRAVGFREPPHRRGAGRAGRRGAGARRPLLLPAALLAGAGRGAAARRGDGRGAQRVHAPWRDHPVRHARRGLGRGLNPGARAALRRVTRDLDGAAARAGAGGPCAARAFYLLQDLPGRFAGGQVWVARDQDRANDSVSPVIIGGHDWAAAWAVDARGQNPYATIPGGARQRILAYRFGVNLVMYALTGNYKGDQVHVPAILERLGN
jgi:hypothetical protein